MDLDGFFLPIMWAEGKQRRAKHWNMIMRMGQCKISSESKEKSPLCQHPRAARMMKHGKQGGEEVTTMERRWRRKMKDNNTYTGDGDDLDLVTLEKINRERERKRERDWERQGGEKEKKKETGEQKKKNKWETFVRKKSNNINILINKCAGRKKRKRDREKGRVVLHTVIESENNSLKNKQSCHSNKHGWLEIQQQYTAGRDCGVDPARKSAPRYNKAFYGKVR